MKKQTAFKYAEIVNDKSSLYFWPDYDSFMKKWFVAVEIGKRRFFTVKDLKKYMGGKL